jgi:hypothetical protein
LAEGISEEITNIVFNKVSHNVIKAAVKMPALYLSPCTVRRC